MPLPEFTGQNLTVLLHDGGGNRDLTLAYTARLIIAAKANGYTFTTLATSQAGLVPASGPVTATRADTAAADLAAMLLVWPERVLDALFFAALATVALSTLFSLVSIVRMVRRRRRGFPPPSEWGVSVAVVLAAYNESCWPPTTRRR